MNQILLPPNKCDYPYTISEVTESISYALESMGNLLWVEGSLNDFKISSMGHCYMKLSDEESQIPAVMWKSTALRHGNIDIENGMKVTAIATLKVYKRGGYYQLEIHKLIPNGTTSAEEEFNKLVKKLAKEGLFDKVHKKVLPSNVKKVGIATSKNGAAIRDILKVISRRSPSTDIVVRNCRVQGEEADKDIANAVRELDSCSLCDVIIVGRGGGSSDDLSCFNSELLARTIYKAKTPIISAVGHEIDTTLCDLVADKRAATPSEAAEIAVSATEENRARYNFIKKTFKTTFTSFISRTIVSYKETNYQNKLKKVIDTILFSEQSLDLSKTRLTSSFIDTFNRKKSDLHNATVKLNLLNPLNILTRGYSITTDQNNRIIENAERLSTGNIINTRLKSGKVTSEIINIFTCDYGKEEND